MNRSFPLLVLLMALPASAGDADHGKKVFTAACANCHVARPAEKDSKNTSEIKASDNLALWLSEHSGRELRQWVKDPWALKPKTRCDPRQLQPKDVEDLLSFLRGAQAPAPSAPAP
ncbi:MAG: c-type cytochrome [Cystobacter sp.]